MFLEKEISWGLHPLSYLTTKIPFKLARRDRSIKDWLTMFVRELETLQLKRILIHFLGSAYDVEKS